MKAALAAIFLATLISSAVSAPTGTPTPAPAEASKPTSEEIKDPIPWDLNDPLQHRWWRSRRSTSPESQRSGYGPKAGVATPRDVEEESSAAQLSNM
ncbi:hypothetical protein B0H65DRAFT_553503 [Neurospora tetraspora]|uniref:Uncharacterized protein n=1 Tax=Neurospora tetraspora TaxID=94610 RepID=A0AAE0J0S2_9PEZI|nr:hypothetical protein B0H65DRAFT_553503 [Neurospora tetraspora]